MQINNGVTARASDTSVEEWRESPRSGKWHSSAVRKNEREEKRREERKQMHAAVTSKHWIEEELVVDSWIVTWMAWWKYFLSLTLSLFHERQALLNGGYAREQSEG